MPSRVHRGELFVVSAPSGAGKSTLIRAIQPEWPDLCFSVSCTTRSPRATEVPGREYHFLSREEFSVGIETGRFLEWAEVHGEYYGTDGEQLEAWLSAGRDVLLDIDVQGARQVRCAYPAAHNVFILPPSLAVLEERLKERDTESPEKVAKRIAAAHREIQEAAWYDYIVLNDVLAEAIADFNAILRACHCERSFQSPRLRGFLFSSMSSSS